MKKINFTIVLIMLFACSDIFSQIPQLRPDNIDQVLSAMTTEEKVSLLVGGPGSIPDVAGYTREIPRLGIPTTVLADGPAGLRIRPIRNDSDKTYFCTGFPVGTALASSWDIDLVEEVTQAMGNEVLEYGVDVLLAPGMNIHRNPLCGRNFEYFSEDPVLSGRIAAAYVRGIQSNGVGTSIKHYAANNQETNRLQNDARISERALREIYLKNFEIAVKEGKPWTVMSSYNKLNGAFTQQRHDLLTTLLRDEWGFDGIVMTDWGCKEGTVASAKAGNDLMEPGRQVEIDRLMAAVQDGSFTQEELDRNVRRLLQYIVRTPHFKGYHYSDQPDLKAHAAVARKGAEGSTILLRNENNTLPLNGNEKVALYGVSSINFRAGGEGSGHVNKAYVVNMAEAMEAAGFTLDQHLTRHYQKYVDYREATQQMNNENYQPWHGLRLAEIEIPLTAIDKQAKNNDVAVVVLGRVSSEGADRPLKDDYALTAEESDLLRNVSMSYHAQGKKVVVVLDIVGVIETESWKDLVDAIVLPWNPGQDGAYAVADILCGKVNPSGKLPMTFPVNYMDIPSSRNFPYDWSIFYRKENNYNHTDYDEGIWVGYRYFQTEKVPVSYPFGFGLSYTTFAYSKPSAKATKDGFTAEVTVTNTGNVAGREVVEVYVNAPAGNMEKPLRELKAFAKTRLLAPGERQTLTFSVSNYELASFNEDLSQWESAAGPYQILFAASVDDIRATASYTLKKPLSWPVHPMTAN